MVRFETFPKHDEGMVHSAGEASARDGILEPAGGGDGEAARREQHEILIQYVE